MATCRTPGCTNKALPEKRGLYANLCAEHKQERYDARHNGAADARAAGEAAAEQIMGVSLPEPAGLIALALNLDGAKESLRAAEANYRDALNALSAWIEQQNPYVAT